MINRVNRMASSWVLAAALGMFVVVGAAQAQPSQSAPADADGDRLVSGDRTGLEGSAVADRDRGGGWMGYVKTLLALGLVVALILLGRWAMGKARPAGMGGRNEPIQIVARKSISTRQHLLLIRLGGRLLLVVCGPGGFAALSEISEPKEVADLLESIQPGRKKESK